MNLIGGMALAFGLIAMLLVAADLFWTVFALYNSMIYDGAVAYPTVEAEYAAHYDVGTWQAASIGEFVPSAAAVVLGALGLRRPRSTVAAIALGVGGFGVVVAIVNFFLSPMIAAAIATAQSGGMAS